MTDRVLQTLLEQTVHAEDNTICRGDCPKHSHRVSMCNPSRCTMAVGSQSITQATLEGEREDVVQLRTLGLGVTKSALDVFSNFVQHIATNVVPTSAANATHPSVKPLPRRSRRFELRGEAPSRCPQTQPTPPQTQVRSPACLSGGLGSKLGFGERRGS